MAPAPVSIPSSKTSSTYLALSPVTSGVYTPPTNQGSSLASALSHHHRFARSGSISSTSSASGSSPTARFLRLAPAEPGAGDFAMDD